MDSLIPPIDLFKRPEEPEWEPGDTNPFGDPRIEDQTVKFGHLEKDFFWKFASKEGMDIPKLVRRALYFYMLCYNARRFIINHPDLVFDVAQSIYKKILAIKGT